MILSRRRARQSRRRFRPDRTVEDELRMMDAQIEMHMHSDPNVARAMMEGLVRAWGVTVREGM